MTAIEVIDDTVKYYATHDRGVAKDGSCTYDNGEGGMCAFGRCMSHEGLVEVKESGLLNSSVDALQDYAMENEHGGLDFYLKELYQGQLYSFWSDVQSLHDTDKYWTDTEKGWELSNEGIDRYNVLIQRYR